MIRARLTVIEALKSRIQIIIPLSYIGVLKWDNKLIIAEYIFYYNIRNPSDITNLTTVLRIEDDHLKVLGTCQLFDSDLDFPSYFSPLGCRATFIFSLAENNNNKTFFQQSKRRKVFF